MSSSSSSFEPESNDSTPYDILIIGGGIVGASIAYYASLKGADRKICVVEQSDGVRSASAFAGGYLSRTWCQWSGAKFGQRAFDLHETLANTFGAESIEYRRVRTHDVSLQVNKCAKSEHSLLASESISWCAGGCGFLCSTLADEADGAQVHPRKLTERLIGEATLAGVHVRRQTRVVGVQFDDDSNVLRVSVETGGGTSTILARRIAIATGAWCGKSAASWCPERFGALADCIYGSKVHSVVASHGGASADALFVRKSGVSDLELFPRPTEVYACGGSSGPSSAEQLPECPSLVDVEPKRIDALLAAARRVAPAVFDKIEHRQACYVPTSRDGMPLIGKLVDNAYVAAGHSVWGILLGPLTGLCVAEMLIDGSASTCRKSLEFFDPRRFDTSEREGASSSSSSMHHGYAK
jgi:glycine/D-amino acid oxidase-like deaminating enzyme